MLLELDPKDDPAWIFFDTQHHRILQSLRTAHSTAFAKYKGVMLRHGSALTESAAALNLRSCVASLQTLEPNLVYGACGGVSGPRMLRKSHRASCRRDRLEGRVRGHQVALRDPACLAARFLEGRPRLHERQVPEGASSRV